MKTRIALAAAMSFAFALPAAAAVPMDDASAQIRFGDLDLSNGKGFATLTRRIDNAAERICGAEPRGLAERSAYSECRADVISQAHAKLRTQIAGMPVQMAQR